VTTPDASGAGQPSDKLYAPLNAPKGAPISPGVQPGTTGPILAQYVIIFGTSGGMYVYAGTPAKGNPPVYSVANSDTDPYGNTIYPGIWAGQYSDIQVGFQVPPGGNFGEMIFRVPGGPYTALPAIFAILDNGGVAMTISGAQDTPVPDQIVTTYYDNLAGNGSSAWQMAYIDTLLGFHQFAFANFAGLGLGPVSSLNATEPGTGTSLANVAVVETWHNITLDAGWTAVVQPQYMMMPGGQQVAVRGQASHAGTAASTNINGNTPIPSGYFPAATRVYRPPTAGDTAGTVEITTAGVFVMRPSGFTATQVFMDGIYSL
jgi:hypothetical protein